MKALVIIIACVAVSLILKVISILTSGERMHSVGAKANSNSKNMPKIDVTNEAELRDALKYYNDMAD